MAALTTDRSTPLRDGRLGLALLKAGAVLFGGAVVAMESSGFAVRGSTRLGLQVLGIAEDYVNNSAGDDGDAAVDYQRGVFQLENSGGADAVTKGSIGKVAYLVDDQTVAKTDGAGTRSQAGLIVDVDDDGVWVQLGFGVSLPLAGLLAGKDAADLASADVEGLLPLTHGGTGSASAEAAREALGVSYGTEGGTVVEGNDPRLEAPRPAAAHASSHGAAGDDAIEIEQSQVVGLEDALAAKATSAAVASTIEGLQADIDTRVLITDLATTEDALNAAIALKADTTAVDAALALKATSASLAQVATSGAYADLSGKPTLGTASAQNTEAFDAAGTATAAQAAAIAASAQRASNLSDLANAATARTNLGLGTAAVLDVPASGDAASGQAVKGSDSRLTNDRAASGIRETSGPTLLTVGAIVDGQFLKRVGSTLVSAAAQNLGPFAKPSSAVITGLWHLTHPVSGTLSTSTGPGSSNLRAHPFMATRGMTITKMALLTGSAVANAKGRWAVFQCGSDGYPTSLVGESGELDLSPASTFVQSLAVAHALVEGALYWGAYLGNVTPANLNLYGTSGIRQFADVNGVGALGITVSQAYGPMPSTFPAGATVIQGGSVHPVLYFQGT